MIRIAFASLLIGLCASISHAFDGDVISTTTFNGQTVESSFTAKGDKMKVVMPQGQGSMIIDSGKNTMTIIMDAQKMYMVQPMNKNMVPQSDGTIEDTGETAEILGYPARKLTFTESNGKTSTIWATDAIQNPALNNMPGMNESMINQIEKIFGTKAVFPLKMTMHAHQGQPEMTMQVTKVVEREVSDSEISVPEGYTLLQMPAAPGAGE